MICSIHSETLDELNIDELISSFLKKTEWIEDVLISLNLTSIKNT